MGFRISANAAHDARIALPAGVPAAVFTQVCEATGYTNTCAGIVICETEATGTSGVLVVVFWANRKGGCSVSD